MRILHVALAGAAVAGVVAAGSAFTAGNSMPATAVIGYGHTAISGADITGTAYTPVNGDASLFNAVVFTTSTDVTDLTATLTLTTKTGNAAPVQTQYTCDTHAPTVAYASGSMEFTCSLSDTPAFADLTDVALTVHS